MGELNSFSNIQIELLKLYSKNVSDEQLHDIKLLLSQYFANQASDLMDQFIEKKGLTSEDMKKWTNEHSRRQNHE